VSSEEFELGHVSTTWLENKFCRNGRHMNSGKGGPLEFVDTTLRDGQMSLWATNMRTSTAMSVIDRLDAAGFVAMELIGSSFFKKCVRELREDPWERLRMLTGHMRTPGRAIRTRHITAFHPNPRAISQMWMRRLAANGIRQVRISDPSNTVEILREQVALAREAGLEAVVNFVYSVSPKHTDEYYVDRIRGLATLGADALCLKDPGGLLTPEWTRSLARQLTEATQGHPPEIHNHCNNGLGPLNALEALEEGVRVVSTAVPPLSDGSSLPSIFDLASNAEARGYVVAIDTEPLRGVEQYLRRVAVAEGRAVGHPLVYDAFQERHQVPGGMISNFRQHLGSLGLADRVDAVLEEAVTVRADLGFPIMVTPYSQFVGTQAAINVIAGSRYTQLTDEVIKYALGHWGCEEAADMDPDVRDRLLDHPRARELAADPPRELSVGEVREQLNAGPDVGDDELLLRYLTSASDVETMKRYPAVMDDGFRGDSRAADLIRGLASILGPVAVEATTPDLSLRFGRSH